jgi:hypothetical protein
VKTSIDFTVRTKGNMCISTSIEATGHVRRPLTPD